MAKGTVALQSDPLAKGKAKVKKPKMQKEHYTPEMALKAAGYTNEAKKVKGAKVAKGKAKLKAKPKAKPTAKGQAAMKKPATWTSWAQEEDVPADGEEEEEEEPLEKDYEAPTKAQAKVFEDALKRPVGTGGSLPVEIHEVWNNP